MTRGSPRLLLGALLAPIVAIAMAPGPLGPWTREPAPALALGVVRGPAGGAVPAAADAASLQQTLAGGATAAAVVAPAPPTAPPVTTPPPPPAPPPPAPPPALVAALEARLADPRLAGLEVGLSVWLEGFGEVAARNADLPLLPASNQKLVTAMGILAHVPITDTLVTEVRAAGAQDGVTLVGDLILVGGGDPTLTTSGPHSLDALARAVRARGITRVAGVLVADETRYDSARGAGGWLPTTCRCSSAPSPPWSSTATSTGVIPPTPPTPSLATSCGSATPWPARGSRWPGATPSRPRRPAR